MAGSPGRRFLAPAVQLAKEGFEVDTHLAESLNDILEAKKTKSDPRYKELLRVYGHPDGRPWQAGDRLVQPDLAATLQTLADSGPRAFYTGSIAEQIVAEMHRGGGFITREDLREYRAHLRPPIRTEFRGYEILGPPPPSSGGICVKQVMGMLSHFDLQSHERFSPFTMHIVAEAMRRAFAERARYLGDADFVEIPDFVTGPQHIAELAKGIDPKRATPSEELAREIPLADEGPSTTHFSVIDANGMAVSNTYTLENSWGSRIVVHGAGFVLNNEMGDFNWKPGHTDRKGRIGTPPNVIAPGKRMLSSQTPVIVMRDGRPYLITGSPGGRTIINTVLSILISVLEFDLPAAEAVASPRMHHQWFPDVLVLERSRASDFEQTVQALKAMGHQVSTRSQQGSAHTIWVDRRRETYVGVADYRRGGAARGVSRQELRSGK